MATSRAASASSAATGLSARDRSTRPNRRMRAATTRSSPPTGRTYGSTASVPPRARPSHRPAAARAMASQPKWRRGELEANSPSSAMARMRAPAPARMSVSQPSGASTRSAPATVGPRITPDPISRAIRSLARVCPIRVASARAHTASAAPQAAIEGAYDGASVARTRVEASSSRVGASAMPAAKRSRRSPDPFPRRSTHSSAAMSSAAQCAIVAAGSGWSTVPRSAAVRRSNSVLTGTVKDPIVGASSTQNAHRRSTVPSRGKGTAITAGARRSPA